MNITLIGMPGAGKTTVGKKLAEKLNYRFIDIDLLIEKNTGLNLQQIIDNSNDEKFMETEEKTVLELGKLGNSVISPGGSVVYSEKVMKFLKENSVVVFLNSPFGVIEKRLTNMDTRGIVGLKKKGLKNLFNERMLLYKKYADVTIEMSEIFDVPATLQKIIEKIQPFHKP